MQRRSLLKMLAANGAARATQAFPFAGPATGATPRFFFNQLGFLPHGPKLVTATGVAPGPVRLRRGGDNAVVWTGTLPAAINDEASGDGTAVLDLSAFAQPGSYVLEAAGQRSEAFRIDRTAYADALRLTVRAYYGQRCGCAVDLGGGYKHPACHAAGGYHASTGKSGSVGNAGGWHDAGDYGRYVVNSGITCGTLLYAWEMFPEALRGLKLDLPDAHSAVPEYLREVLWNLNWMMALQDTDGGVFHKQTSDAFCAFIMPEQDHLPSEIIGTGAAPYKNTAATGDFAAVMAIAARCYRPYDTTLADRFLRAAKQAFDWVVAHPDVPFRNPAGVTTGEYGDSHLADEPLWAAAELWRTTGEPRYQEAFLQRLPRDAQGKPAIRVSAPGWSDVTSMALWAYALAPHSHQDVVAEIHAATVDAAGECLARYKTSGYGNTLAPEHYVWGSNGVAGNQSLLLIMANRFAPDATAVRAALGNLDYLLGRNCHGVSWVTQVGTRPFLHPHHRPSAADGLAAPWPGLLSGGPNRHPGDAAAKQVQPAPPMRMWIDVQEAYSMNEVAINWNAPLVFVLAFANQLAQGRA